MRPDKITNRILGLLNKAQGTDNEDEAAAFMAGAQRLMAQHAIEESMIRAAGRRNTSEVIEESVDLSTTWRKPDLSLLSAVARANDCSAYGDVHYPGDESWRAGVVGHAEDVSNVLLTYGSLQIQLGRFLKGTPPHQAWRRAFRYGFAGRVNERLKETRVQVVEEMAKDDPSLLPVLAEKADAVKAALPPGLRKARAINLSSGHGYESGEVAGNRADVGGPAMPTGAKALNA